MRVIFCSLLLLILTACSDSDQGNNQQAISHKTNALVDSDWLEANLENPNIRLLSLGNTVEGFSEAHIPTAFFLDWKLDISDQSKPEFFNVLPVHEFEKLMRRLSITESSTIVLYDNLSSRLSTRVYWMLKYYGHNEVRILDGGRAAWERSGRSFTPKSDASEIHEETIYTVSNIDESLIAYKPYIESRLTDTKNFTLVDGRPFDQYTGEAAGKTFHKGIEHRYPGHIYGAQSVQWMDNFNEDGTFKSAEELTQIYGKHEVNASKTVVTYCNEGLHAAPPWFVLKEILGFPDVKLYDSSMAEWANESDISLVLGEHCM